jgi:hypothetical protein
MKSGLIKGIIGGISLVSAVGFASAALNIGQILNDWNTMGVFSYILPFLLVFAMVYGILNKSNLFGTEAKGVNVILALALGLISLFSPFPEFIQRMAPNLAIGLSVLLALMLLLGLFTSGEKPGKWISYGFIAVGVIIFLSVTYSSFQGDFGGYGLWDQYGAAFITLLILIGLVAAVVGFSKNK